eukprot:scaffold239593_cov17-Prasinocladus_malaysianus.AAC.2
MSTLQVNSVELKPGGQDIYVTEDNRREFVELYADYILVMPAQRRSFAPTLLPMLAFACLRPMPAKFVSCAIHLPRLFVASG